jgi:hypothetical protein
MTKIDVSSPILKFPPASHSEFGTARRLIVLFPASETDTPELDHRIWEIARSLKLNVLLLSLSNSYDEEAQLRRKLITMAAVIKDPYISTEIMIEHGNNWVKQVSKIWRNGDVTACYAGHKVGLMRKPLDQVLKSRLETAVYIISEYQPTRDTFSMFISSASAWLGSLTIIGVFFWAEAKIVLLPQDWAHTVLIYAFVILEIFFVWLWNLLFT